MCPYAPAAAGARKRDVRLPCELDEDEPMFGAVYAAPLGQAHPVPRRDMTTSQAHLVFDCAAAGLSVRVVLGSGVKGDSPRHSVIMVPELVEGEESAQSARA